MPTPQGPDTNRFRCETCGRHFNTDQELREHQKDCLAAHASGGEKPKVEGKEEREDRDWVSTP